MRLLLSFAGIVFFLLVIDMKTVKEYFMIVYNWFAEEEENK